jgi:hypothetical protein
MYKYVFISCDQLNGMSEWVIIVERQMSNFPAVSWREQINFDEIMMMPALY